MISVEPKLINGIFPGQPDTIEQWLIVRYNNTVIANLPLRNEPWQALEEWAYRQIDLYLGQQKKVYNV